MTGRRRGRRGRRALSAVLCATALLAAPPGETAAEPIPGLTGDFEASADRFQALSADTFLLEGNVTFRSGDLLLQAARLVYDSAARTGEAQGNVLFARGETRLSGDSLTFDLAAHTATLTNATGYLEDGYLFRAKKVEQLDQERLRFEGGMFTACTQPLPYWSFGVSSGTIVLDRYVHLRNMVLRAGGLPIFYSPYLAFPIKPDRATGLLLPQFGFSQRLGTALGNAFFWDIARNQDTTFFLDLFSEGSVGVGAEYRLIPNRRGAARFNGYFIQEDGLDPADQPERDRWYMRYGQRQDFRDGGRFIADLNLVSDPDYYLDFSRDPDRGLDPTALSRVEYSRTLASTAVNLRLERREQFFAVNDVLQLRLPEAEVRMRSTRLGNSPIYMSLESSASLLDKEAPGFPDGAYGRVDAFPSFSIPIAVAPFLDIIPSLALRETWYSKGLDETDPTQFGEPLFREFLQFGTEFLGPRFSRIFFDAKGNGRFKSTLEPRLVYRYQTTPQAEESARAPSFDEIDVLPGDLNQLEYGLSTRLYERRRVGTLRRPIQESLASALFAATGAERGEKGAALEAMGEAAPEEDLPEDFTSPVEVATLSISQVYSFLNPLSLDQEFIDTDNNGLPDTVTTVDESFFSPVVLTGRYNPSQLTSVDARLFVDVLEKTVSSVSLSAGLASARAGFLNATWFYGNNLDGSGQDSSQMRVSGGTSFFRNKISTSVSLSYDASLSRLQDQRYRFGYDTQCCGVAFEVLERDYIGTQDREFRFVLNLKGIGNFIDLQEGGAAR